MKNPAAPAVKREAEEDWGREAVAVNALKATAVLRRATKTERGKPVYAMNKFGGKTFDYDASPAELAMRLAFLDRDALLAAPRKMCEHYWENLPILEEIAALVREGEDY